MFVGSPFGIKHIPSHVQRFQSQLLSHIPNCHAYIDDIVIGAKSKEELISRTSEVLDTLTLCNFKDAYRPREIKLQIRT